ncbi:MAG TPA: hypothetical protein VMV37_00480 [Gammaproteobacteria bacterium]|nr:hypothetical protein [Gammaproteobacteria bacterium]
MTSARRSLQPGHAHGADGRGGASDERDARVKRSAWLLTAFAILFYVGYIAFNFWRSTGG